MLTIFRAVIDVGQDRRAESAWDNGLIKSNILGNPFPHTPDGLIAHWLTSTDNKFIRFSTIQTDLDLHDELNHPPALICFCLGFEDTSATSISVFKQGRGPGFDPGSQLKGEILTLLPLAFQTLEPRIDRLNCGQTGRSIRMMKTSLHAFTSGGRHLH